MRVRMVGFEGELVVMGVVVNSVPKREEVA